MLDLGFFEFALLGGVALVVIGPKELPGALRTVGRVVAQARSLARDFRDGLDDIARESEVKNITENMIGDFDDDDDEHWMKASNTDKLNEDADAKKSADGSETNSAETKFSKLEDIDEMAADEADAGLTKTADKPSSKSESQ